MDSESTEAATVSNPPSSAGEKLFPPGFRFHPTDEELILYYLKRKTCGRSLKLDIIALIDVYKWHPNELPGQSKWKTGDRQWFYFCPRDRKYSNGGRSSRATMHGFWKATGKDRVITCKSRSVGFKKTLVYYEGRAPTGQRTDWVMHEYTLDEEELKRCRKIQDYYSLCKVFNKSGPGPKNGEQYGAPFVEEEWADDHDYLGIDELLLQNVTKLVNEPKLTSGSMVNGEDESQKSLLAVRPSREVQPDSDLVQPADEPSVIISVEELQQPLMVPKDFLELDDLISPQPAFQNSQLPMLDDDMQFAHFDGFRELDFYDDLPALSEMNLVKSQQIQYQSYTSNFVYETENSGFHSYLNAAGSEAINTELQAGYDLSTQGPEVTSSMPAGVETPKSDLNQCRKNREDNGSYSWFSSAVWDFVESVPTRPASALESSALVNKTFEHMPSFCKMSDTSECTSATRRCKRSLRSSNMGIFHVSFLGVLFALLIVCVGISFDLMGKCKFR